MGDLACVSISGCDVPLDLLEALSYRRDELAQRLPALRTNSGASGVVVLSTCQRVEVYGAWPGRDTQPRRGPDRQGPDRRGRPGGAALIAALARDRDVPEPAVRAVARTLHGRAAARHVLRVASGLESFVPGESEIAGQVRAATAASRAAGVCGVVLERLMDAAISASRKTRRRTSVTAATRSVASVAVDTIVRSPGRTVSGQRLLVVGAGQVAEVVVRRATAAGAEVTVCNRTRRHAARFAAAGARVVDLADLPACLAGCDIAILATAAPRPLVDARILRAARPAGAGPLTLADLSLPRNVDPDVRALPWVRLIDLADLRDAAAGQARDFAAGMAVTEEIIESELGRYLRWLAGQSAAAALGRIHRDAENIAREELARAAGAAPGDVYEAMERALLRTVHRLAHGPTRHLLTAAQAGDTRLVNLLGGLFDAAAPACSTPRPRRGGRGARVTGGPAAATSRAT